MVAVVAVKQVIILIEMEIQEDQAVVEMNQKFMVQEILLLLVLLKETMVDLHLHLLLQVKEVEEVELSKQAEQMVVVLVETVLLIQLLVLM